MSIFCAMMAFAWMVVADIGSKDGRIHNALGAVTWALLAIAFK